jgi:peptidylprolyl isomerase domain and WD repeat-containing protein 1
VLSYVACQDCPGEEPWTFPNRRAAAAIKYKTDTDLYELAKKACTPCHVSMSATRFAVTSTDSVVRVFDFATGRIVGVVDECAARNVSLGPGALELEPEDFDMRLAREAELADALMRSEKMPRPGAMFDQSGRILLVPGMAGIKMVDVDTQRQVRVIGRVEAGERFCALALFQGFVHADHQIQRSMAAMDTDLKKKEAVVVEHDKAADTSDPVLVCLAFGSDRLFAFTTRDPPDEGRDVFNEKPSKRQQMEADRARALKRAAGLPRSVTLNTTLGDIALELYPADCPKTVENFVGLCRKGYYDNVLFHRVIRGFMVQTGDPNGDGTGGASIWGGEFEDEIVPALKHDQPWTLSMANAGPNTNASQFFITTAPTPHLDGKHTVFGRVVRGQDTVQRIEGARTDPHSDRPLVDVKIVSVMVG